MSFPTVLFLTIRAGHVLLAATWLGSVAAMVLFVMPALKDTGAAAGPMMGAIAALVEAEVRRFPDNVGHVLGSRRLRRHQSLVGRLTYLAWKGRDAVGGGAAYCRKLIGQP